MWFHFRWTIGVPVVKTLIVKLNDDDYFRLQKLKDDKYPEKDWSEFFAYLAKDVQLTELMGERISRTTKENLLDLWISNFGANLPLIRKGRTIGELVPKDAEKATVGLGPAVIIGAGPSLWKYKHLEMLAQTDKPEKIAVVASDRMVIPSLKAGITPDKFLSWQSVGVDGSPVIAKWYDDPILEEYADKLKICIITSTHPSVIKVLKKHKVDPIWYNPVFDDWRDNESYTRLQRIMTKSKSLPNGIPAMGCLGNCGSAGWVMSHSLLRRSSLCLIGINFGYDEDTPLEQTNYFSGFLQAAHGNYELAKSLFQTLWNPYFKCNAIVDPVFNHYRQAMLDSVNQTPPYVETYNCSEGGSLFSSDGSIKCMRFEDWLKHCDNLEELHKYILKEE